MLSNYHRTECIAVSVSSLSTMLALAGYTPAKTKPAIAVSILQGTDGGPDLFNDSSNGKL